MADMRITNRKDTVVSSQVENKEPSLKDTAQTQLQKAAHSVPLPIGQKCGKPILQYTVTVSSDTQGLSGLVLMLPIKAQASEIKDIAEKTLPHGISKPHAIKTSDAIADGVSFKLFGSIT